MDQARLLAASIWFAALLVMRDVDVPVPETDPGGGFDPPEPPDPGSPIPQTEVGERPIPAKQRTAPELTSPIQG